MNANDVITLSDNKQYLILDNQILNDEKYCFVVEIDADEKPTDKYLFMKINEYEDGEYYEEIEDNSLKDVLLNVFAVSYGDMVDDYTTDIEEETE